MGAPFLSKEHVYIWPYYDVCWINWSAPTSHLWMRIHWWLPFASINLITRIALVKWHQSALWGFHLQKRRKPIGFEMKKECRHSCTVYWKCSRCIEDFPSRRTGFNWNSFTEEFLSSVRNLQGVGRTILCVCPSHVIDPTLRSSA